MNTIAQEFAIGIQVEKEHTHDDRLAAKIANDHLSADPLYYSKLMSAGLVDEPEPQVMSHIERGEAGSGGKAIEPKKDNSVSFGRTPQKGVAPTEITPARTLINQTTGAKMPNQVNLDKGTTPLKNAVESPKGSTPVCRVIAVDLADATEHFISQAGFGKNR